MEISRIITVAGIFLNTIGVVLIFVYGLSPMIGRDGYVKLYSNEEISNKKSKSSLKKGRYKKAAFAGLLLCVLGGALQIVSAFI